MTHQKVNAEDFKLNSSMNQTFEFRSEKLLFLNTICYPLNEWTLHNRWTMLNTTRRDTGRFKNIQVSKTGTGSYGIHQQQKNGDKRYNITFRPKKQRRRGYVILLKYMIKKEKKIIYRKQSRENNFPSIKKLQHILCFFFLKKSNKHTKCLRIREKEKVFKTNIIKLQDVVFYIILLVSVMIGRSFYNMGHSDIN